MRKEDCLSLGISKINISPPRCKARPGGLAKREFKPWDVIASRAKVQVTPLVQGLICSLSVLLDTE